MNYGKKVLAKILALILVVPFCVAEQDYQEQLEAAIVQSNVMKVKRLLKRRNRTSVKNFQHMLGWSSDVIEERRMLEPTPREVTGVVFSGAIGAAASIAGLCYYFDINGFKLDVRNGFESVGGEKGFCGLLGAAGLLTSYGCYKWWSGPRKRLQRAYQILFAIEDTVDGIEKKKKAREQAAKRRELRSRRIA